LDFFETVFEIVNWDEMNQIASCEGFPVRYPHWRWGMNYDQISKSYQWGLSKIYELVINNDPCYAYLLRGNSMVDQKLIMAHVYAHCDFFKNNLWFAPTNRRMIDELASHASRIQTHIDTEGYDEVERFLDSCLSLDNLIDIYSQYAGPRRRPDPDEQKENGRKVVRFRAKSYMEPFINPPEFIEEQRKEIEDERRRLPNFPERPERDVLWFLVEHAPLRSWQRDILAMMRDEAYYFAPQRLTKIMNEGWASYWHSTMMTQKLLDPGEVIDFAERHAGAMVMQSASINPYKLGIELFRDIEERWDKGRFGKEYDECDDLEAKRTWDTGLGEGRQKIFNVRKTYNDVTFVDEFLTPDFCDRQKLFTYEFNPRTGQREISGRDFTEIKDRLLRSLANGGQPIVEVADGNFRNRGELVMQHRHDGEDLRLDWARQTLEHMYNLWTRPVHIQTTLEDEPRRLSFDGSSHEVTDL
jgi:stage V sporulation protein R